MKAQLPALFLEYSFKQKANTQTYQPVPLPPQFSSFFNHDTGTVETDWLSSIFLFFFFLKGQGTTKQYHAATLDSVIGISFPP